MPFCFEVAFANFKTTIIQAEGLQIFSFVRCLTFFEGSKEYLSWIQAIRNGIEKSLVSGIPSNIQRSSSTSNAPMMTVPQLHEKGMSSNLSLGELSISASLPPTPASRRAQMRPTIEKILSRSPFCAECDRPGPDWVSLNIGCIVCIDCSGVHRSMGVHISKMRSLTLDDLEPAEYNMLLKLGKNFH